VAHDGPAAPAFLSLFGFMPETAGDFNQSTGEKASELTICNDFSHKKTFWKAPRSVIVVCETPGKGCCTLVVKDSWLNQGGTRGITF
jgi:hypothetical protein